MSALILFLHLFYFIYSLVQVNVQVLFMTGVGVVLFSLITLYLAWKKDSPPVFPVFIIFLFLAALWFALMLPWPGVIMLILAILDLISERKLKVIFFSHNISYPSFPDKRIPWFELNNAILKDRILTLDFKNDRLLQAEICKESYFVDEELFNAFCRARLVSGKSPSES